MTEHPITPPPELVQRLYGLPQMRAIEAAFQAGADQELEACCEWLVSEGWFKYEHEAVQELRAARRPKPPSLKEQAIAVLDDAELDAAHYNILLRALEQLDA
jgi:ABC-type sugar transport system ATPase subunit